MDIPALSMAMSMDRYGGKRGCGVQSDGHHGDHRGRTGRDAGCFHTLGSGSEHRCTRLEPCGRAEGRSSGPFLYVNSRGYYDLR